MSRGLPPGGGSTPFRLRAWIRQTNCHLRRGRPNGECRRRGRRLPGLPSTHRVRELTDRRRWNLQEAFPVGKQPPQPRRTAAPEGRARSRAATRIQSRPPRENRGHCGTPAGDRWRRLHSDPAVSWRVQAKSIHERAHERGSSSCTARAISLESPRKNPGRRQAGRLGERRAVMPRSLRRRYLASADAAIALPSSPGSGATGP